MAVVVVVAAAVAPIAIGATKKMKVTLPRDSIAIGNQLQGQS